MGFLFWNYSGDKVVYFFDMYNTAQKMKFSVKELFTFTKKILYEKLHFLDSVKAAIL